MDELEKKRKVPKVVVFDEGGKSPKKDKDKKKKKKKKSSDKDDKKRKKKKEKKSKPAVAEAPSKRITLIYPTAEKPETRKLIRCPAKWDELVALCTELLGQPIGSICLPPDQGGGEINDLDVIEAGDLLYVNPKAGATTSTPTPTSPTTVSTPTNNGTISPPKGTNWVGFPVSNCF